MVGQRLLQAALLDALVAGKVVGEALDGDEGLIEEALRRGRSVAGQEGELFEAAPDSLGLAQQGSGTEDFRFSTCGIHAAGASVDVARTVLPGASSPS